ncbi:MAG: type III pantothenate kinase [Bacteroidales bacterium]|jgi:type III pantothenate kinase|nr:type III pantothenate kinase [Bacteroidales bacterium]
MILVIDQGNTRCKLALFDEGKMIKVAAFEDLDEQTFSKWTASNDIKQSIYSSVAQMPDFLLDYCRTKAVSFRTMALRQDAIAIHNLQNLPLHIGEDLLALAVYAQLTHKEGYKLIISMGTCITYETILSDGTYGGGSIAPGMSMRAKALKRYTNQLPEVDMLAYIRQYGDSVFDHSNATERAIGSGVYIGITGEVKEQINIFLQKYKSAPCHIFLTGGDAAFFFPHLVSSINVVENMVLKGMAALALRLT